MLGVPRGTWTTLRTSDLDKPKCSGAIGKALNSVLEHSGELRGGNYNQADPWQISLSDSEKEQRGLGRTEKNIPGK